MAMKMVCALLWFPLPGDVESLAFLWMEGHHPPCNICRTPLKLKELLQSFLSCSLHSIASLALLVLLVLQAVGQPFTYSSCSKSLHVCSRRESKESGSPMCCRSTKIELQNSLQNSKVDSPSTSSRCKVVFCTMTPNETVQALVCILCFARLTSRKKPFLSEPLVNQRKMFMLLVTVQWCVY